MRTAAEVVVLRGARAFGRWWLAEMRDMLPAALRRGTAARGRVLEIRPAAGRLSVSLRRGDRTRPIGHVALAGDDPDAAGRQLAALLAESRGSFDRLHLVIPAAHALTRRTRLPLAARDNLDEALGYDMDRQTPFAEDEVYYGARLRTENREAGWIEAELEVVRRADAEPGLAAVRAAGLQPDRMVVADGQGADLMPPAERRRGSPLLRRATATLALACVLLGGAAAYLPLHHLQAELAATERHLAAARQAAVEVEALRERRDLLQAREAGLHRRKAEAPMALEVLDSTTRALPDDAFVLELRYDGGAMTLNGYARSASGLIGHLEDVAIFQDASFRSPVTQDSNAPGDRYNVGVRVLGVEEVREAAR